MPSQVNLTENSKLITKQNEVSKIFNRFFFTNVASDIGKKECLLTKQITLVHVISRRI